MACPAIITGERFLTRVVEHIDCQAQFLGSYGYQALGEPGSIASTAMLGLLTLFIALFGVRLLFGRTPSGGDVVYDVLKIGIVLTLAFSWPAFRTVIYDLVMTGPAQIATSIATPGLPDTGIGLLARLQNADDMLVHLIEIGTGRNTGAFLNEGAPGTTFAGTALQDDAAFGYARLLYLAGSIGSLGLIRILAGLLLALAPLAAGLLLFEATRGIFAGWLKGLVLAMLGSIGLAVVLAAELAMIQPWLTDALRVRTLGYAAPSAPLEIFAMTLAFTIVKLGIIWLLAKVAFGRGWPTLPHFPSAASGRAASSQVGAPALNGSQLAGGRVERTVSSIERRMESENTTIHSVSGYRPTASSLRGTTSDLGQGTATPPAAPPLGSSWRRSVGRVSRAARRRDSLS